MGALRNFRHERFAREYVKSGVAGVAYSRAYNRPWPDNTAYVNGCRLLRHANIKMRVYAIRKQAMKRSDITIEKILQDYQDALDMARELQKPAEMKGAAEAQAKLVGLLRDRVETGNAGDFDNLEDISAILEKVAQEVGPKEALALAKILNATNEPEDTELHQAIPPTDAVN